MSTIAIFLNTSWNIYNFRLSLLKALQADGHDIICIAPKDEYSQRLQDEGFHFIDINLSSKSTNPLNDLKLLIDIILILRKTKPQILLNFTIKPNLYGTLAAKICKVKTINNVSGLGTVFLRKGWSSTLAKVLYKFAFKYPSFVFFQNLTDKDIFVRKKIVNPHIVDVLPGSGVDLAKFSPDYETYFDDTITFLMPARLLKDKGVYEYIQAARIVKTKYSKTTFLLIGKPDFNSGLGVDRQDLKTWIHEGIIDYHGFTDHMIDYYKLADCVVLPSYREGTSKTLLEALAMGKPIITTDVPGCKETVHPKVNGFLCKSKDFKSLLNAMEQFIALQPEKRLEMGKSSRLKAELEFDEKFVINKYKKVIFEF